ncbi:hypothetical protein B0A50_03573 [Salinomyces thailandicus]|uniref:Aspartyl aminopeptidase n=1 Tax=Salinomyces thailandicus TaxID=706561 RepID=A0A4U0U3F0_9PEZI|nr:hypothetical protein B0A50_03573 [Salinomyces thailandica]
MVRNISSIHGLREGMAAVDITPSNIETTAERRPSSNDLTGNAAQSFVSLNTPMPLHGSNDYTKALMTRIATGDASPEERARWEQHVAAVRSRPVSNAHNSTSNLSNVGAAIPDVRQPPPGIDTAYDALKSTRMDATRPTELHPTDVMADLNASSQAKRYPTVSRDVERPEQTESGRVLADWQMQLMLLEQQNKRRMLMARQEQDRMIQPISCYKTPAMLQEQQDKQRLQHRQEQDLLPSSQSEATVNVLPQRNAGKVEKRRSKLHAKSQPAFDCGTNMKQATRKNAADYTGPFCKFLTDNPTVFHAVDAVKQQLKDAGFMELSERDSWNLKPSGSYFVERNGSSLIAFTVGAKYEPGNGAAILAGHVDALTTKLKPISQVPNKAGYLQLGVAPYAGAPNTTWWDRDLSIGGRVLVKEGNKVVTKLVKLDWPIARIPTLAPHFGEAASGPFNPETQMTPIIGLDGTDSRANELSSAEPYSQPPLLGGMNGPVGSFVNTQPPRLVKAIGHALGLSTSTFANIVNWELELYDTQPAQVGGLDKEFIFAGRVDDKLCSWAAIQALLETQDDTENSSMMKVVGLFDNEEIGSLLRQGARGNFLPQTMERAVGALADHSPTSDLMGRTYANSFIVSSDVIHAVNPNFLNAYLENHAPHLNVGVVVSADSNGHMTTDSISTAIFKRCADKVGAQLQVFQIRNDSRSGGTVGPMLSSMTGIRAIDAGIPQLSMHSIRATTGSLDPGLGVLCFAGFLNGFESVDKEFREC